MLIYSYIKTSGNWENEKLCVDITIYQYKKNVLYLFYNIAQRNIKKEIFRRFRVDIRDLKQTGRQRDDDGYSHNDIPDFVQKK